MTGIKEPFIISTLPALEYACERCGLRISHDHDKDLVRAVAAHHNALAHRRTDLGRLVIRWEGFAPPELVDRVLGALCERYGSKGLDVWVDEFGAEFSDMPDDWLDECLELLARYVGPDLTVIDRWRYPGACGRWQEIG